jgi:hypothetical protein
MQNHRDILFEEINSSHYVKLIVTLFRKLRRIKNAGKSTLIGRTEGQFEEKLLTLQHKSFTT